MSWPGLPSWPRPDPLSANGIHATPDFATDPSGAVIPLTSHIRLANPRTPRSANSRILRRGYNYGLKQESAWARGGLGL